MDKWGDWWVADFETVTINTAYFRKHQDTTITLGGIMNVRYKDSYPTLKKTNTPLYYEYTTLADFMRFIQQYRVPLIFFHNLQFDGAFIIKWCLNNKWRWINEDEKNPPPKSIQPRVVGRRVYNIKLWMPNGHMVTMMCSYLKLCASVADLGKGLKLDKYDGITATERETFYDVEPMPRPEDYSPVFRAYLKRDCDIVRRSLMIHFNEINDLKKRINNDNLNRKKLERKWTVSGLSYTLQEAYTQNEGAKYFKGMTITHDEYKLGQLFYFGGFTQFNPDIQHKGHMCDGMSIDCNSMHPTSMTMRLPYGAVHNLRDEPAPPDALFYRRYHIDRAWTKHRQIYTLSSRWYDAKTPNRYMPYLENFECYYEDSVFAELQHFNQFEGVKVLDTYWCHADTFLKPFVEDLYAIRLKHKQNKDEARSLTMKILLNGAYGKHGERETFDIVWNCQNAEQKRAWLKHETVVLNDVAYWVKPEHHAWANHGQHLVRLTRLTPEDEQHNKFIASTITGYSFVRLLQAIRKIGVARFLYCDTDSVYFQDPPPNLTELLDIDPNRLGAWKVEKRFEVFIVAGAKGYATLSRAEYYGHMRPKVESVRFAGVSKQYLRDHLNLNMFKDPEALLENARIVTEYTKSGIVLIKTDYKMKPRYN